MGIHHTYDGFEPIYSSDGRKQGPKEVVQFNLQELWTDQVPNYIYQA